MIYNILISILLAVFSFLAYKFHKFWLKNSKNELLVKEGNRLSTVKHWAIILGTALFSVIYFLKAIIS